MGSVRRIRQGIESSSAAPLLALFDAAPTGPLEHLPLLRVSAQAGIFIDSFRLPVGVRRCIPLPVF